MSERASPEAAQVLTRRAFARMVAAAGAAIAFAPHEILLSETMPSHNEAIVSFHMDRPYLDRSGTAIPYYPPAGARSAQFAAQLSEEEFRRSYVYA
ncbi:MAG TPA: twin-arginine translocation signal domain-containing protein [Candidatus Acidoferrales bacterium]|nr:twin-arginine translocation signal domain-containing protein [Candidatus Acidoferrales bacterium]